MIMQQKITIDFQGLPREPVGISTAPVVETVAAKPENELVIPLDELNQKKDRRLDVPNQGRAPSF